MKRFFTASLLLASAGLTAAATAAPIQVTGYNHDIVAEAGSGAITTVTTSGIIGSQQWTLAEAGYTGAGALPGVGLAITADTVTTKNGTVFAVDPDANNALVNDGTLVLGAPGTNTRTCSSCSSWSVVMLRRR